MEIRSYRAVFDLERRIYRVDRLRLNPTGVPVRGVVYFLAAAALCAMISAAPGVDLIVDAIPWYMREIALPGGLAALMAMLRIDGRPFHIAALSMLAHAAAPREVLGCGLPAPARIWRPEPLLLLPDGSDARMRRAAYVGPGAVLVAVAHERRELAGGALAQIAGRPQLLLRSLPGRRLVRPQLIELAPGARLHVR
jgi:hypothetical protein